VAEDAALLERRAALVHVQVGPADVRRGDLDQDVGRLLDPGVRDVLDPDVPRACVDNGFHSCLLQTDDVFHLFSVQWLG
jgi:hypothetical protein